ncbi:MAG: DUF5011 domain-containing protein [Saprospiraceae bacterium]|nr:DUF5011 domain-containing protein [Saprospiraceae bacterium]MBK9721726.1 DUF5011 domain-containing protein [Saprospiraceae bacterium]
MKNYSLLYLLVSSFFLLSSCEEETTDNVSRITYFPIITLTGQQWNTVKQGGSWTDPGAKAFEGESEITLAVGGDQVDTNVPGVYTITYTAVNKDGYSATEYRYIGVIAPEVEGVDMSGQYKRNAGALGVSTVKKISDNFYSSDNVGGVAAPGPATTVYFYHYQTKKLGVPLQLVAGSPFYCDMTNFELGVKYSWRVINSGYGPAVRTFVKL